MTDAADLTAVAAQQRRESRKQRDAAQAEVDREGPVGGKAQRKKAGGGAAGTGGNDGIEGDTARGVEAGLGSHVSNLWYNVVDPLLFHGKGLTLGICFKDSYKVCASALQYQRAQPPLS